MSALSLQAAALSWVVALIVAPEPWATAPALLIGLGLLTMSTVSVVGMIVVGGRWAHRLGLLTVAFSALLAIARPIDWIWWVGVLATILSTAALLSPVVTDTIRKLPAATGPNPRAIAPPLVLLATPCVLGFVGNGATPWALLVVGISAPNAAFLYSRVFPGGLLGIRLVWPLLALGLSPLLGWPAGAAAALIGILVAVLAWDGSVKASYHPPLETGSTFPIPPELAPGEVLDAADVDDRGRRK